jgi:hypothetical protein
MAPMFVDMHIGSAVNIRMPDTPAPPPEWPEGWPDDCPAGDTPDCEGTLFRLIRGPRDWDNARDRGAFPAEPECLRVSLSCYVSIETMRSAKSLNKGIWADAAVVRADLTAEHGKMLATRGLGHRSLWLRAQYWNMRDRIFQAVE